MESTQDLAPELPPLNLPLAEAELRAWMTAYIAALLALDPGQLDASAHFDSFGIDSIEAVVMAGVMEEEFGQEIDPTHLFLTPSVALFAATHCRTA